MYRISIEKYPFFLSKNKKIQIRKNSKNRFLQNRCRSSLRRSYGIGVLRNASPAPPRLLSPTPNIAATGACVHTAKAHGGAGWGGGRKFGKFWIRISGFSEILDRFCDHFLTGITMRLGRVHARLSRVVLRKVSAEARETRF